ncbi:MAG: zinc-dependent peptidase [Chitinophagaceae bacterium]|nr:zinc-dependent peptidase [Chitinophagaceae bacterium]
MPKQFPHIWREILIQYFSFYNKLNNTQKELFEKKIIHFLSGTTIKAIDFQMTDKDYIFIASSAVIPVFHLEDWLYPHLNEVLLHQDSIEHLTQTHKNDMELVGLVNVKLYPQIMHISRKQLWIDIKYNTDANVALHEFIHLIDYDDSRMDGIPLLLFDKKHIVPWVKQMMLEMKWIYENKSSLNTYAGESPPEFLATICEHYFQQPEDLKLKSPTVFYILEDVFKNN